MPPLPEFAAQLAAAALGAYRPPPLAPAEVRCPDGLPSASLARPIRVLCWNIQYCGGREAAFFYDGGARVRVPEAEVRATIRAVGEALREADADVVMLQEVDRGSDRTHRIDQLPLLAAHAGYPAWAATPYHQVRYLPFPAHEPMGRVNLQLAVLSRFRIGAATRRALAPLVEPAWRRAFNLRRAILDLRLPLAEGGEIAVLNTHLSAFSRGDGTLGRQVGQLLAHAQALEAADVPWLLGGDLNALPPGDDPKRLAPGDTTAYAEAESPVAPLFAAARSAVEAPAALADPARWGTYVPFGLREPDRTIDYLFTSRAGQSAEARVLTHLGGVSDHLPIATAWRPRA